MTLSKEMFLELATQFEGSNMKFETICHSDWSMRSSKRWMCRAHFDGSDWRVRAPEPVGNTRNFFERVAGQDRTIFGFDFPIGLPAKYAGKAGFADFRSVLNVLSGPDWESWFSVCESAEEISERRPFYPFRPGGTRQAHLIDAHQVAHMNDLKRSCERLSNACSMFWTLGGNQVGKGMITGWQEVILPSRQNTTLWPFDGGLSDLAEAGKNVVCETYPGAAYGLLDLDMRGRSKRCQADRKAVAVDIRNWRTNRPVRFEMALEDQLADGFGSSGDGEDPFDAVVGLMKMIDVVLGELDEMPITPEPTRQIEGWILGLGGGS